MYDENPEYDNTYFQIYVVLEVLYVVLEVYHAQHTFKHVLCWMH